MIQKRAPVMGVLPFFPICDVAARRRHAALSASPSTISSQARGGLSPTSKLLSVILVFPALVDLAFNIYESRHLHDVRLLSRVDCPAPPASACVARFASQDVPALHSVEAISPECYDR